MTKTKGDDNMKVVGIWKDGDVRITHTLVVDAQNIHACMHAEELAETEETEE